MSVRIYLQNINCLDSTDNYQCSARLNILTFILTPLTNAVVYFYCWFILVARLFRLGGGLDSVATRYYCSSTWHQSSR